MDVAARYANKRKAFGQPIRNFEAVNALAYTVPRTIDDRVWTAGYQKRLVSELKRFATQTQWEVANEAMQILGGIGYTRVFPIERTVRETRLLQIWTGTNDVQNLIIQHEYYKDLLARISDERDIEADVSLSEQEAQEEQVYELG